MNGHRHEPLWLAAMAHRISGLALSVFLPAHFLVLGLALEGEASLDGFLRYTENPWVKLAEASLVLLLAVHLLGGLRVLVIENLPWTPRQKELAAGAVGLAVLAALTFLARAW